MWLSLFDAYDSCEKAYQGVHPTSASNKASYTYACVPRLSCLTWLWTIFAPYMSDMNRCGIPTPSFGDGVDHEWADYMKKYLQLQADTNLSIQPIPLTMPMIKINCDLERKMTHTIDMFRVNHASCPRCIKS